MQGHTMMRWRRGRLGFSWSLVACACISSCTLDSLWGTDAPRPSLHPDDTFDVDPLCRDLTIDSASVAPVPGYVTVTGKRRDTGLGAEAVPVAVMRGRCSDQM